MPPSDNPHFRLSETGSWQIGASKEARNANLNVFTGISSLLKESILTKGVPPGEGASLIPVIKPLDQKDKANPDDVDAGVNADADVIDPEVEVPEVEPELGLQPMDAEVSSPEEMIEPTAGEPEPSLNLESVLASFAAVRVRLDEFDAALSQSVARLQMPQVIGEGLSDDVKRAIIETAENTAQLAERARTGGFVFS